MFFARLDSWRKTLRFRLTVWNAAVILATALLVLAEAHFGLEVAGLGKAHVGAAQRPAGRVIDEAGGCLPQFSLRALSGRCKRPGGHEAQVLVCE